MCESFVLLPTYFYIFRVFYKEIWYYNIKTSNVRENPNKVDPWVGTYVRGQHILRLGAHDTES